MTVPTPDNQPDVEQLVDAFVAAVERGADSSTEGASELPRAFTAAVSALGRLGIDFVRRYNRLEINTNITSLDQPVLFVANHGFGGIFDLNVLAVGAALQQLDIDRPVTFLTHQIAWTLGVGRLIEPLGARPASRDSARQAFDDGHHVVVLPGGDLDAFKSWGDRNRIVFGGRTGFARVAIDHGVPIVPIVTAGGGESLLVLSSGERLARALRLDKLLRLRALPLTVSLPWGVNTGAVGFLPYLPLPTKLHTRVLPSMARAAEETTEDYAERVRTAMQHALDALTRERKPILG